MKPAALACLLALAACSSPEATPDAAPSAPDAATVDAGACLPAVTPGDGWHYAGMACNGCHAFAASGTVYAAANGGAAVTGATVRLVDGSGTPVDLVVQNNGNFWTSASFSGPLTVTVSKCPDTRQMPTTVTAPADCNGCHASGSRIHLP